MKLWSAWGQLLHWPYWGVTGASVLLLMGILLKVSHLNTFLLMVKAPYKKYARLFFRNLKLPLQWILILSSFLLLLYHGHFIQIHSPFLLHLLQTVLILLIVWSIWRQTTNTKEWIILYSEEFNHSFHKIAVPIIRRGARLVIFSIVLVVFSYVWGFSAQNLLTGMGVIGVIVSISFQDIIKNSFSAFMLLVNKVFDIGDSIQIDQTSGTVEAISLRFTTIRTREHGVVTIPNNRMADSDLINWSKRDRQLVQLDFSLGGKPSLETLYKCIQLTKTKLALKNTIYPESLRCQFDTSGGTNITLSFLFDVRTTDDQDMQAIKLDCYQDITALLNQNKLLSTDS
ncbi:mechanosensitive ion channel [Pullulanibacillus sp. KACC 23026]|uniref:mechanosensitive ion channel family protein n=1 Tax=Pullulanibacillus sp. KACC 23026 TaxID=3028315 RepID=UPI0023AF0701|nr:mechanosensitive ion channel domain-containing protein [Pullulanibacillus sp. KACC 23026]WEG14375.1 mechanosensitive ion channel [Pullulanibacillus sp. KACC 23026]